MNNELKKFTPLAVSSKFAICGIPLRADTYKNCTFGCTYCFSNNRKIMEFDKNIQIANLKWLENKLDNIFNKDKYKNDNFLDMLIKDNITWHCGGMSDPFQPIEKKLNVTKGFVDITNKHNINILFSTKSNTTYGVDIRPELHSFQLSISNVHNNKDLEPNVPDIKSRKKFFDDLKAKGFKVGIRVQPFIPNITTTEIIDMFEEADWFTIEGIKIVPQNREHKENILNITNIPRENFTQMGLLNLKPDIRIEAYKEFIDKLEEKNIPYSIADNDLHYISKGKCCCGDTLIKKSTKFNNTALAYDFGNEYTIDDVYNNLGDYSECRACNLFTSNRQEGCKTVKDFYDKRFYRKTSPFSPKFLYKK